MPKKWIYLSFILFLPFFLGGQEARFYASTDATEIVQNSYVEVSFTLENVEGSQFRPPAFEGFKVLSGPSTSNQMSIVNGKVSRKMSYGYNLLPQKTGSITIGSASIKVGNKTLKTSPIKVKVVKAKEGVSSQQNEFGDDLFIELEISDTVAFRGQQVLLKYVVYSNKDISSADLLRFV